MIVIQGKPVCGGISIGNILFIKQDDQVVKRYHTEDIDKEIQRFEQAQKTAILELDEVFENAKLEVGEASAMIFDIHKMMLDDDDFTGSVRNIITIQQVNAEYAVSTTSDNFAELFAVMDDEYMKARAADVRDISKRLLNILQGKGSKGQAMLSPMIIAADDLAPSETVTLDKDMVLAFLTSDGSTNSHTAILARTMNIPAIIGIGDALEVRYNQKLSIVDGYTGKVFIEPDDDTLQKYTEMQEREQEKKRLLTKLKGKDNITKSGKRIDIFANIGSVRDLGLVLQNDAGGIGLFRSEFLYLESEDYPSEEKQFSVYKSVLETMGGKKVVIRTLDIGADKQIEYFNLPKEENPALGMRAIRICLTRPEIFKTQLRALLRASVYGRLSIMFPMIISVDEVKRIWGIIDEIKSELKNEGIPYSNDVEFGIMIETPAAAVMSDELAKLVDFFSIGSNDLTQYVLAIDRQNEALDQFCDVKHPALLRLIKTVADNAHKSGIWVGICGELGANEELMEYFISIGIDELSVVPSAVLPLRDKVIGLE